MAQPRTAMISEPSIKKSCSKSWIFAVLQFYADVMIRMWVVLRSFVYVCVYVIDLHIIYIWGSNIRSLRILTKHIFHYYCLLYLLPEEIGRCNLLVSILIRISRPYPHGLPLAYLAVQTAHPYTVQIQ